MKPRVLLSSVFKPFGVDNLYSRKESKIELYHNQLTKSQGIFSPRAFTNTCGLHAIANNVEVPMTVLEFPTFERFRKELRKGYDIVGIGSILANFQKVKRMVDEIREISPGSTIVLGGFCAAAPDIEKMIDVDHVCEGEGISFMRDLLRLPPEYEFKNPDLLSDNRELLGVPLFGIYHPLIIVGLGCSYGCDFCSPSHFFKRRHVKFFTKGRDLLDEMMRVKRGFGSSRICFTGDDNFLIDLKRAEELRKCVVNSGQIFDLLLFASADKVGEFGPERLSEMGAGTIWIGRESKFSDYRKNRDLDMAQLVAELRNYGITTILSSILLLDQHTKKTIEEDIDDHLACRPAFSQFAHYAPVPGTPLFDRLSKENRILTSIPFEEWHAFKQPWFIHPEFTLEEAEKIQDRAYERDFRELGPSIVRFIEAEYLGWLNLKDSPKPHLRARARYFASKMRRYKIMLLAMERLVPTQGMRDLVRDVRRRVESSYGKATALDKIAATGLFLTGRFREFRNSRWGDALQPRTQVVHYNGAR
jgi:hypothetical protein